MSAAPETDPDGETMFDSDARRRGRPRPSIHDGPPSMLYTVKQVELAVRSHLDDVLKPAGITALSTPPSRSWTVATGSV